MAGYDPQAAAAKWKARMGTASEDYKRGVQRVTVSPTQLAAQNQDKLLAGIQDSVNSGRYAAACNAVTLQQWQQAAIDKGSARLSSGANAAFDKVVKFQQKAVGIITAAQGVVKAMPSNTFEERMARSMAFAQAMHASKGSF